MTARSSNRRMLLLVNLRLGIDARLAQLSQARDSLGYRVKTFVDFLFISLVTQILSTSSFPVVLESVDTYVVRYRLDSCLAKLTKISAATVIRISVER
jgi:hypothetical protein